MNRNEKQFLFITILSLILVWIGIFINYKEYFQKIGILLFFIGFIIFFVGASSNKIKKVKK